MFPSEIGPWSIVHSYGFAAVVGWFRPKLSTEAAVGVPRSQPESLKGRNYATVRPLVGMFLSRAIEVHTTSIGNDW